MVNQARTHTGLPQRCPLVFTLDGRDYTLPELSTRSWLDALVLQPPGCWWQLIPAALSPTDGEALAGRLFDPADGFDLDDLEHAATSTLTAALGVDFWAGTRLAGMVVGNWTVFDGWSYTRGMDPLAEPVSRVLNAAYHWRRDMCEKRSEVSRLDAEIWAPPPPYTAAGNLRDPEPSGWSDEQEAALFDAAMVAAGGSRG